MESNQLQMTHSVVFSKVELHHTSKNFLTLKVQRDLCNLLTLEIHSLFLCKSIFYTNYAMCVHVCVCAGQMLIKSHYAYTVQYVTTVCVVQKIAFDIQHYVNTSVKTISMKELGDKLMR